MTTGELVNCYGRKLKEAQTEYKNRIQAARKFLHDNKKCEEIDEILGKYSDNEVSEDDAELEKSSRTKYNCPVHKCNSKTFGIKRHLERQCFFRQNKLWS